jgi:hypothetical protein
LLSPVTHLFNRKTNVFHKQTLFPRCKQKMHQDFSRAFILFNYGPPTKIKKLKNAINCKPNKIMIIVCLSKQKYLKCLKLITHPNQWNVFETSRIASTRQGHQKMNQEKEIKCLIWRIRCRLKSKTINYQKNNSTFVSYFFNLWVWLDIIYQIIIKHS